LGDDFFGSLRVLRLFRVSRAFCRDLTGDGRREIVIWLGCCTVGSPDPWAILVKRRGRWHVKFSRVNGNFFGLEVDTFRFEEGLLPAVEEKIPVFGSQDPNCCPSSFHFRYTRWSPHRHRFVVDST